MLPDGAASADGCAQALPNTGGCGRGDKLHVALQIPAAGGALPARTGYAPTSPSSIPQPGFHDIAGGWRAFVVEPQDAQARIPVAEDDQAGNERVAELSATAAVATLSEFGYTT